MNKNQLETLLRKSCSDTIGLLPTGFLCQSLGVLNPPEPYFVDYTCELGEAVKIMKEKKIGCLNVVEDKNQLAGIFTERDLLLKAFDQSPQLPIGDFMTPDPRTANLMDPIAYALNLMSHGGFRHLPLIEENSKDVVGIISIKNIVDHIVSKMTESLLNN